MSKTDKALASIRALKNGARRELSLLDGALLAMMLPEKLTSRLATSLSRVNAALDMLEVFDEHYETGEVIDTIPSTGGLRLQVQAGVLKFWVKVPGEAIDLVNERRARAAEAAG